MPHLALSTAPLFSPGQGEAFLDLLIAGRPSDDRHVLNGHAAHLDAVVADIDLMLTRAYVALALWALPVLPTVGVWRRRPMPLGAHPARVEAHLIERSVQGAQPDPLAARAWLADVRRFTQRGWRNAQVDQAGVAALGVLHASPVPVPVKPTVPPVPDSAEHVRLIMAWSTVTLMVLEGAARLRTVGPNASDADAYTETAMRAARACVVDVFERHVRGGDFPILPLTQADLVMVAEHPEALGRQLALTLAAGRPDATHD